MRIADDQPKINGVHVMHLEANFAQMPTMNATYALGMGAESSDGVHVLHETHGQCSAYHTNWSPHTLALLGELVKSMEQDLLPVHFKVDQMEEDNERIGIGGQQETPQI